MKYAPCSKGRSPQGGSFFLCRARRRSTPTPGPSGAGCNQAGRNPLAWKVSREPPVCPSETTVRWFVVESNRSSGLFCTILVCLLHLLQQTDQSEWIVGTLGIVLTVVGAILAFVVGLLITIGVIPLNEYFEDFQEKKARERRERERQSRGPLGQPTSGRSTSTHDTPPQN